VGAESSWEYVPGGCTGPCQGGVTIHLLGEYEELGCTFVNDPVGSVDTKKSVGGFMEPVNKLVVFDHTLHSSESWQSSRSSTGRDLTTEKSSCKS
jgi:hypothetical protein